MRSTPRTHTLTLSGVTGPNDQHGHRMPRRRLLPWITAAVVVLALSVAGLAFWLTRTDPDAGPATSAEPATAATSASTAATRPAKLGEPFNIARWRITVTKVRCGSPAELDVEAPGVDRAPRVCVADFTYTNTDTQPHRFNEGPDGLDFTPYRGFDAAGNTYEADRWAQPVTNPGLSGTNQLVIDVGPGVTIVAVQIDDVRVATGP